MAVRIPYPRNLATKDFFVYLYLTSGILLAVVTGMGYCPHVGVVEILGFLELFHDVLGKNLMFVKIVKESTTFIGDHQGRSAHE